MVRSKGKSLCEVGKPGTSSEGRTNINNMTAEKQPVTGGAGAGCLGGRNYTKILRHRQVSVDGQKESFLGTGASGSPHVHRITAVAAHSHWASEGGEQRDVGKSFSVRHQSPQPAGLGQRGLGQVF